MTSYPQNSPVKMLSKRQEKWKIVCKNKKWKHEITVMRFKHKEIDLP